MLRKINFLYVLFLVLFSVPAFSQVEEQRKYVFKNPDLATLSVINGGGVLNGLTVNKHSDYVYFDMYLDTQDLALLKNKLSLRIRKRNFSDGTSEYGIQLKSEMLKPGDVRMEIDESELDYFYVFYNNSKIALKETLERIFHKFDFLLARGVENPTQDSEIAEQLKVLRTWLEFKICAPIGPFQKLRKFKIRKKDLKTLAPVLIGKSVRARSHVYIDRNNTTADLKDFKPSQMISTDVPEELQNTNLVWLMETSFDQATFYAFDSIKFHNIVEYEVENKYRPLDAGRGMVNRLEEQLVNSLKAEVNLESKYLQSMKEIFNK